jgi:superfamily II DNA or RNA helicase
MVDSSNALTLQYYRGTVVALWNQDAGNFPNVLSKYFVWDERTLEWRSEGRKYREIVTDLLAEKIPFTDQAKNYNKLPLPLSKPIIPRQHQKEALSAWIQAGRNGVVSLPTGAGKTILAMLAMAETARPTLVVVPTIDLLHQWHKVVATYFNVPIGLLGGGQHDIEPITIATYDSCAIHFERLGNRFGLLIFDECHHLPGPTYSQVALGSIAPFRLGLSATVERQDGKESEIYDLIGEKVYEGVIHELEEKTLAPYDIVDIEIDLTPDEWSQWSEARGKYLEFVRRHRINFSSGRGWSEFLIACARYPDGEQAMANYRHHKKIEQSASGKLKALWGIAKDHAGERIIVFTNDNDTAYRIGREFLVPVLTHHTKSKERVRILEAFKDGTIKIIATSKVLNEGVDVPEASVGVVISGSGTVREHVQRLGRILRHKPGKTATLYEIISRGTAEHSTSDRRRQHYAYQGTYSV